MHEWIYRDPAFAGALIGLAVGCAIAVAVWAAIRVWDMTRR